jgi:hypothetical protein
MAKNRFGPRGGSLDGCSPINESFQHCVFGVLGAAIMLLLFVVGQRRYRSNHAHLVAARTMHVSLDGAVPLAFCALITSTISVAGLIFIFF